MEEQRFAEIYRAREREVSRLEKQQLFLQALDILLVGDTRKESMVEGDRVFIDSNGNPGHYQILEMIPSADNKWSRLKELGISFAAVYYWPERTHDGKTYRDQVNLEIHNSDGSEPELYTMKAIITDNDYWIAVGNRREISQMQVGWMEISRVDADRVSNVLAEIQQTPTTGLAS